MLSTQTRIQPPCSPCWISMANISTAAAEPPAEDEGSGDSSPDRYGRVPISPPESCPQILPPQDSDQRSSPPIDTSNPIPPRSRHQMGTEVAGAEATEPNEPSSEEERTNDFVLDSVIPVHATAIEGMLSGLRVLGAGDASSITRRDGKNLLAIAVGLVQLGTCFSLADVHCFPGLGTASTLVSVHQLTRRGFSVMFCGASCYVQDRSTGAVVGKGQLRDEDGLYHLDHLRIPIS